MIRRKQTNNSIKRLDDEVYNYQNRYTVKIFHYPISNNIDLNKNIIRKELNI